MTIEEIVADAERAFDGRFWPPHELDDEVTEDEQRTLYLGAAGMAWALRRLGSQLDVPLEATIGQPGLLVGDAGVLLVSRADDTRLQELVDDNERNPSWELLWGSPGTIVAAKAAGLEWRRSAEILYAEWERCGFGLWTQTLPGSVPYSYIGAAHGFAGNVHALRGFADDDELRARIEPVLREHAVWDGDTVNWPPAPGTPAERVQWCHGAPGIVATLGDLMPEDLLLAAAELTWRTGPLEKGPGLCHGTAGNGYALLRTYEQTGDELWLERARFFAEHALANVQRRYSLFTGDIGAALFADAVERRDARFPILDVV